MPKSIPARPIADVKSLVALIDHTLLKPDATSEAVARLVDECLEFGFKACCVNPWHVKDVALRLAGKVTLPITVVGFPLGANLTRTKVYETELALDGGAREIDMVINIGAALAGNERAVREDIAAVVKASKTAPVKVILETCYLQESQIRSLTAWCVAEGAAFVKTSTGFGSRGASVDDIRTMVAAGEGRIKVKASGGIKTLTSLLALAEAGADRVGSSASVALVKEFQRDS